MADDQKIVLLDEDDNEIEFTFVDYVEVEEKRYVALLPDEDPENGVIVLRIDLDENGEDVLVEIEDDAEFDQVVEIFSTEGE